MSSFTLLYCVNHIAFASLRHHLLERHSVMTVLLEDLAWQPALPLLLQACLFTPECLLKGLSIDASMYTSLCQYRSSQNAQHLWN